MSKIRHQDDDAAGPLPSSGEPVCSSIANDRLRNATSNVLLGLANDMLQSSTPHHQTGHAVPSATRSALVPERRIAATKRSADQDYKPHGGGAGGRKKTKKCSDKRWTKRYVSAPIKVESTYAIPLTLGIDGRFTWPEEVSLPEVSTCSSDRHTEFTDASLAASFIANSSLRSLTSG